MDWVSPLSTLFPMPLANYEWSLRQERMYLLSTLASEEVRCEGCTQSLRSTRAKLHAAERIAGLPPDDMENLRKAASGLSRKLKSCQRSQRIMARNLAAVNSRISTMEQHRWRRLQFDYQQAQNMPHAVLGMQNLSITSPVEAQLPPSALIYPAQPQQRPASYIPSLLPYQAYTPLSTIPVAPQTFPDVISPFSPLSGATPPWPLLSPVMSPTETYRNHNPTFQPYPISHQQPPHLHPLLTDPWSPTSWSSIADAPESHPYTQSPKTLSPIVPVRAETSGLQCRSMSLPARFGQVNSVRRDGWAPSQSWDGERRGSGADTFSSA